jgi:hypothetical protein
MRSLCLCGGIDALGLFWPLRALASEQNFCRIRRQLRYHHSAARRFLCGVSCAEAMSHLFQPL